MSGAPAARTLLNVFFMKTLRLFACVLATLGAVAVATGCSADVTVDPVPDSSIRVVNRSDFDIFEIRVTSVGSRNWGDNLLDDVLAPDEALTVEVSCGTYDTLVVFEDDVECELRNLDLCFDDADWVIGNNACFAVQAAAAAKAAGSASTTTPGTL
jgi:hypothetical protein